MLGDACHGKSLNSRCNPVLSPARYAATASGVIRVRWVRSTRLKVRFHDTTAIERPALRVCFRAAVGQGADLPNALLGGTHHKSGQRERAEHRDRKAQCEVDSGDYYDYSVYLWIL
jgi:hypothetical protein